MKSVVQDDFGFIWVCTENGLAYFDGLSFTTFNAGYYGLSSNRFNYIARGNDRLFVRNSNNEYIEIKNLNIEPVDDAPLSVKRDALQNGKENLMSFSYRSRTVVEQLH